MPLQQKKEQLKASILAQIDEGCTFTPVISNKAKSRDRQGAQTDERPVRMNKQLDLLKFHYIKAHERLYQQAKHSEDSKHQRKLQLKNFDFEGNRLFVPNIKKDRKKGTMSHSPDAGMLTPVNSNSHSLPGGDQGSPVDTVAVDEFLYQDARDRESRIRMRNQLLKEEIAAAASKKKINGLSTVLLKKKAVQSVAIFFTFCRLDFAT